MAGSAWFVLAIVFVALTFDFINGFHDAANSIATVVSTRVLSPSAAVVWASVFNFLGVFVLGTAVAKTMGKGLVDLNVVDATVILAGLIGAIGWDLITWWIGLPTSSSHALMGGYAGAAVAKAGFHAIIASGWIKPLAFIVLSPLIGLLLALTLTVALSWALRYSLPRRVDRTFRVLQFFSAAAFSLGHGTNDAQKTMGIIVGLLVAEQALFVAFPVRAFHITTLDTIPVWVIIAAGAAIALGTVSGGWRIVKTMGQRLTKLTPFGGFCAETSGAITLFIASHFGIPVSTTHTITGAITGVGAAQRFSAVRWGVARGIVLAWIVTIPAAAGIAGLTYLLLRAVV
jgi:inorganic phosphate transporter, PiT family